jgi:murein DD-endopeptidase MepM/ murein hydrolase activator NlpD
LTAQRRRAAWLALAFLGAALAVPGRAGAAPSPELRAARSRVASLQSQLDATVQQLDAARALLADLTARERTLRADAQAALDGPGRVGGDPDLRAAAIAAANRMWGEAIDLAVKIASQSDVVRQLTVRQSELDASVTSARSAALALAERPGYLRAAAEAKAETAEHEQDSVNPVPSAPGPIETCPVGTPRRFTDTFGAPRSGGRVHHGIDMLAPLGTPVYAVQSGRFDRDFSTLGGITGVVTGPHGDQTYYVHLSRFAGFGSGAHVKAGAIIGYVGDTGNAPPGVFHLHFEYRPRGGAPIDPYRLLLEVCS